MEGDTISIVSYASISPLGHNEEKIWNAYLDNTSYFSNKSFELFDILVGQLSETSQSKIKELQYSDYKYKNLDKTVLYALYCSRLAVEKAGWQKGDKIGVNMGSSRGATELFEKYYSKFKEDIKGRTDTLSSPTTTLGNISSWISHDLQTKGPTLSHSITCSTALHSILNGIAWIKSGLSDKFIVGGTEAANTAFTLSQIKALKIYSPYKDSYPSKTLDNTKKKNTMILGEGAAVFCLEKGNNKNSIAKIKGMGYATEPLIHNISISANANCFQDSMRMALKNIGTENIDVIVMHAPGTIKGDNSELNAIKNIFGNEKKPLLTSNKWKIGHTFGASGALSLELGILMLKNQKFIEVPFIEKPKCISPKKINNVLINAVGFGGNAVSIVIGI